MPQKFFSKKKWYITVFLVLILGLTCWVLKDSNWFVTEERDKQGNRYAYFEKVDSNRNEYIVHFNKNCNHINSKAKVFREPLNGYKRKLPCAYCTTLEEWSKEIKK